MSKNQNLKMATLIQLTHTGCGWNNSNLFFASQLQYFCEYVSSCSGALFKKIENWAEDTPAELLMDEGFGGRVMGGPYMAQCSGDNKKQYLKLLLLQNPKY